MTTKEKFVEFCIERGMSENQAEQVVNLAMTEIDKDECRTTWNRPAGEYPNEFYAVAFLILPRIALNWIEKNIPTAWYRPLFDLNDPICKEKEKL